jgi:HopA1 effector protein family
MYAVRDLTPILAAVEIRSPTSYALRGEVRDVPAAAETAPGDLPPVVPALQAQLYSGLYCRAEPAKTSPHDPLATRDFANELSRANCGKGTWEPGWLAVGREDDDHIAVRKDGLTVYALPSQFRTSDGSIAGRLKIGKELRGASPGFYFAIGDSDEVSDIDDSLPLVRAYFNLTAAGAVPFIAEMTRALNRAGVPFRAKTLSEPRAYVRADAAVLYLGQRYYRRVEREIAEVYRGLRRHLRAPVPRFSRALAPGLGIAEDPGTGESFGQHRCRLVALGLWRAFAVGANGKRDRAAAVAASFVEAGLDPKRPHLARGSTEDYEFLALGAP